MFDTALAENGYAQSARSTGAPRQVEYKVFAQVTRRITAATSGPEASFPKLAEAMHENLKLWLIIASDVASDNNELPLELRAKLFNLAEFTRKHTAQVLEGNEDPSILVEINTAIMRGLRGDVNTDGAE